MTHNTKDSCMSTIGSGLSRYMNTDGMERQKLEMAECRSLFDFSIVKTPSYDILGRRVPGHYHLKRTDTNEIIPSAGIGERFSPVQHSSVLDFVCNHIIKKREDLTLESVGTFHGGGTSFMMVQVGEDVKIDSDDSKMKYRIAFVNPCNGYGSLALGFSIFRMMSMTNLPIMSENMRMKSLSVHHTKHAEIRIDNALKLIASLIVSADETMKKVVKLSKTEINDENLLRIIDKIYPHTAPKGTRSYSLNDMKRRYIMMQFDGGETAMSIKGHTAWRLYNAFMLDLLRRYSKATSMSENLYTGMMGKTSIMANKIFRTICTETEVQN